MSMYSKDSPANVVMPPSCHIISFGRKPENLALAVERGVVGSAHASASKYLKKGARILLHCNSRIVGCGTVTSDYFFDEVRIWKDKIYPHRFEIKIDRLISKPFSLGASDYNFNLQFQKRFGKSWAYKFLFSPQPIPADLAEGILEEVLAVDKVRSVEELTHSL